MKRTIRTIFKFVILPILLLFLVLVIIGGGFGPKKDLPLVISIKERPLLFAHRGVAGFHKENSEIAVEQAIEKKFPGLEIDIQFSADSLFFLCHDKLIRLEDGSEVSAKEVYIKSNPVYLNSNDSLIDQICTLSSIVESYKYKLIFYLDMKRYGHDSIFDLARDIANFITEHNLQQIALIASAHVLFITYLEYTNPDIITVMEGIDTEHPWLYNIIPKKFKPDMIASRQATINDEFIQWLRDNDMLSRYIVYHGDEANFKSSLDKRIEMFIVDYEPYLDRYLKQDKKYYNYK